MEATEPLELDRTMTTKQRAMKMRKRIQKGLHEASEQPQQPPPDYVDPAAEM